MYSMRLGDDGVEHRLGPVDGRRRADRAELELVAGEGEGRGAVAVGGVARAAPAAWSRRVGGWPPFFEEDAAPVSSCLHDVFELLAEEDGDDGRRRLVGAQAVIVAGVGHGGAEQVGVLVHRRG